jgi:hypothetical protein
MRLIVSAALIAAAIIHLLPAIGALGQQQLASLYGRAFDEPNLEILMRHRAALFALLGLFLLAAAFTPALQAYALAGGLASVVSFIWLAWSVGGYNAQLARVVAVDIAALVFLIAGAIAYALGQRGAAG